MRIVEIWGWDSRPGREEGGVVTARPGPRGRQLPAVDVHPGVLLLPLGPPVLEPDLHLGLRQVEAQGEVEPLTDGEISGGFELVLQADQLLVREGRPGSSRLPASISRLPLPVVRLSLSVRTVRQRRHGVLLV